MRPHTHYERDIQLLRCLARPLGFHVPFVFTGHPGITETEVGLVIFLDIAAERV